MLTVAFSMMPVKRRVRSLPRHSGAFSEATSTPPAFLFPKQMHAVPALTGILCSLVPTHVCSAHRSRVQRARLSAILRTENVWETGSRRRFSCATWERRLPKTYPRGSCISFPTTWNSNATSADVQTKSALFTTVC